MAAEVRINFVIGGADVAGRMVRSVGQEAERAARQSSRAQTQASKESIAATKAEAAEKKRTAREVGSTIRQIRRDMLADEKKTQRESVAAAKQASKEKEQEEKRSLAATAAATRKAEGEKRAELRKTEREARSAANQAKHREERDVRERRRIFSGAIGAGVSGAAHGVATLGRGVGAVIRGGMGLASSLAGGAGIEMGLGRSVRLARERQTLSTDLVNASLSGEAAEKVTLLERQQRAASLGKFAEKIGAEAAYDPSKVLEGMGEFVGKTGDLDTAVASMSALARISRATGSDISFMAAAAGDVAANIGEIGKEFKTAQDKGDAVAMVMRIFAGQGKLGAVEVKDLSKQMAGLAAQASMFAADPQTAMASLGALAQMSRQKGGSKSAPQAVTSVQSFAATFSKGARRQELDAAFKKIGARYEDDQGRLLDPEEIIVNALKATGGDKAQMGKLFMDTRARSATLGFESLYREAGGGEKGLAAVRAKFKELRGAALGKGDEEAAFGASMQTMEAKAQLFQQNLDKVVTTIAEKLIPKFTEMQPVLDGVLSRLGSFIDGIPPDAAKNLATALVELIPSAKTAADAAKNLAAALTWVAENPGKAVALAAGVGGAQAGASALLSAAAQAIMTSATPLATAGAMLKTSAMALGVAAAAVGGYAAGSWLTGEYDEASKDDRNRKNRLIGESGKLAMRIESGEATPEEIARAKGLVGQLKAEGQATPFSWLEKQMGDNTTERAGKAGDDLAAALAKNPMTAKLDGGAADAIGAAVATAVAPLVSQANNGPKAPAPTGAR